MGACRSRQQRCFGTHRFPLADSAPLLLSTPPQQEIPPFETKGVMRASFSSREADNHTAFIRIKTNASDPDQFIILPVEVEVTAGTTPPCPRPPPVPDPWRSPVSPEGLRAHGFRGRL